MLVQDALSARKSVRAFLSRELDKGLVIKILEYARCAPSGTNIQPWEVVVVSGQTKRELDHQLLMAFKNKMHKEPDYDYYPHEFTSAMKKRRLACGLQMYSTLGIGRGEPEKRLEQWEQNYLAFGAPTVLYIFTSDKAAKGTFMDCGMFVQSILLMATQLGIGSCAQAALAEYPQIVRQVLNYPEHKILLCGIALGYEDKDALINSYRTPRDEVMNFTQFFE